MAKVLKMYPVTSECAGTGFEFEFPNIVVSVISDTYNNQEHMVSEIRLYEKSLTKEDVSGEVTWALGSNTSSKIELRFNFASKYRYNSGNIITETVVDNRPLLSDVTKFLLNCTEEEAIRYVLLFISENMFGRAYLK